jgi:hypothetical protein
MVTEDRPYKIWLYGETVRMGSVKPWLYMKTVEDREDKSMAIWGS